MDIINIYSPFKNNKLTYILDFVLGEVLDLKYVLNPSMPQSTHHLSYGGTSKREGIHITSDGFLDQKNIFEYSATLPKKLRLEGNTIAFDCFAAIFFLLSRAEEYDNNDPDQHGRFKSSTSILYRQGHLQTAIVDRWISDLKAIMENMFSIDIKYNRSYAFQSTVDIDQFYAFKHKPAFVQVGSLIRDILKFNLARISARMANQDPYDTFDDLSKLHAELGIEPMYFVLCSPRGPYDKNLSPTSRIFGESLNKLKPNNIGLHPSYQSAQSKSGIKSEKDWLEKALRSKVKLSRQHFIRMSFPDTYQNLVELGITNDYSMGYPDQCGFRAGTSYPFKWYDLSRDSVQDLTVYPFQMMDVTLKQYLTLHPDKAMELCRTLVDEIKNHHGFCSVIWHNSSFFELESWTGWDKLYHNILTYAKS